MTPLALGWAGAVRRGPVRAELEAVYDFVAAWVEARGPVCEASGRCCRFEAHGHRLYVTGLEAAYVLAGAGVRPITGADLEAAAAGGGCPYQAGTLCGVRAVRPAGCRVYYCDPAAGGWIGELGERVCREIRAIHARHGIEYRYGPWGSILREFAGAGEGHGGAVGRGGGREGEAAGGGARG